MVEIRFEINSPFNNFHSYSFSLTPNIWRHWKFKKKLSHDVPNNEEFCVKEVKWLQSYPKAESTILWSRMGKNHLRITWSWKFERSFRKIISYSSLHSNQTDKIMAHHGMRNPMQHTLLSSPYCFCHMQNNRGK